MFPLTSALIGQTISGYRVEKLLGRGGTGMVFLGARLDNPADRVAIKILAPAWSITENEMEALRRRFLREFDTYQRLRHPHIVPIRGFGQTITEDDLTLSYMILPYLEGGTLTDVMAKGLLPLTTIAVYLRDLADAIDYAHSKDVVHRDIKPANVLLDDKHKLYLTDFGIAQLFDQQQRTLTASGQVIGTPEYMSPEQASGKEIGPQTDQYSLGVMAFEMAAGRVPFTGPTIIDFLKQHSLTPPPSAKDLRPDLPEPVVAALNKALAKKPEDRFPTAKGFAFAFAEGIEGRYVPETEPEPSLTVHGFTPPKTISLTKATDDTEEPEDGAITPPRTVQVDLREETEDDLPPPKPRNVKEVLDRVQKRSQEESRNALNWLEREAPRVHAWVRRAQSAIMTHKIASAVAGVVLLAIIGFLLFHPSPAHTSNDYVAANPGICDTSGKDNWSENPANDASCPSGGGVQITDPGSANSLADEQFAWKGHAFPLNYSVEATVTSMNNACAGFEVRRVNFQGYGLFVCGDGSWNVSRYDTSGNPTTINNNKVNPSSTYHLKVVLQGNVLSFYINGQRFDTTDTTYQQTNFIGLAVYHAQDGTDASAVFNNFTYAPLK